MLEVRLQTAAAAPYRKLWEGASGTVIMHSVGTEPRFYEGCGDFWYLFQHMACKTSNEAVVEGMGSEWDLCTSPTRHLAFDTGVKEAVVCYNGPPPYRPEAKPFLHRALNTYFEGGPEKWNFEHEDKRFRRRQLGLAASIHEAPMCNRRTLEAEKVERVCMDRYR